MSAVPITTTGIPGLTSSSGVLGSDTLNNDIRVVIGGQGGSGIAEILRELNSSSEVTGGFPTSFGSPFSKGQNVAAIEASALGAHTSLSVGGFAGIALLGVAAILLYKRFGK